MALEVKEAKTNPSRSYPISAKTLPSHPLEGKPFSSGKNVRTPKGKNLNMGRRSSSARTHPTLRGKSRSIV